MRRLTDWGTTLVELMIALVVCGMTLASAGAILLLTGRGYRESMERVAMYQNLRAATAIFPPQLRQLDPADSDIGAISPTALTIRSMREVRFLCSAPAARTDGQLAIVIRQPPALFDAEGEFAAGDSLLLFEEGDPATGADDRWAPARITHATGGTCATGGPPSPAAALVLQFPGSDSTVASRVTMGAPLRGFSAVTCALYQSATDREWYLGMRINGSSIEPVVGPLRGPDGLTFAYLDSSGNLAATAAAVAAVEIRLRARTPPQGARAHSDSMTIRASLRNHFP